MKNHCISFERATREIWMETTGPKDWRWLRLFVLTWKRRRTSYAGAVYEMCVSMQSFWFCKLRSLQECISWWSYSFWLCFEQRSNSRKKWLGFDHRSITLPRVVTRDFFFFLARNCGYVLPSPPNQVRILNFLDDSRYLGLGGSWHAKNLFLPSLDVSVGM